MGCGELLDLRGDGFIVTAVKTKNYILFIELPRR